MRKSMKRVLSLIIVVCIFASLGAVSAFAADEAGYINRDNVNVRSGPGTNYNVIKCVSKDTVVTVTDQLSNGWCKVTINGTTGYVLGTYVSLGTPAKTTTGLNIAGYVNADGVNVRAGAGTNARVIATANKGKTVTIMTEEASGWCGVTIDGQRGYIYGKYVSKGTYTAGTSSSGSGTSTSGSSSASTTGEAGYINRDNVNIRAGAGTNYQVLKCVRKDTVVTVTDQLNNGWCKITINGTTGYVLGTYVSLGTPAKTTTGLNIAGYVNANGVNVRAGAGTDARVITTANKGKAITIMTEEASGWCGVTIDGQRGYIYGKYVSKGTYSSSAASSGTSTSSGSGASASATGIAGYINRDGINVYASASTSASVVTTCNKDTTVTVTDQANGWCKVTVGSKTGYVYGTYVSLGTPAATTTGLKLAGYINADNVTCYANTSTSARVCATASKNTVITIMTKENGWCGITLNNERVYVESKYVTEGKP